MTTKNYSIISVFCIATLVLILIYSFCFNSTKAYADEITEATVTSDTASQTTEATVVQTTRRAPVSIAIYSNEVTESSDTYDFTKKQAASPIIDTGSPAVPPTNVDGSQPSDAVTLPAIDNQPVVDNSQPDFVVTTPAPEAPQYTRDPQSTAAPDATPEPDIISYPPTVAPAYKD
jgi:hypothetical protein